MAFRKALGQSSDLCIRLKLTNRSAFAHGHTYQGHPVSCAAALEVQRIVREDGLVDNVRHLGGLFGQLLRDALDSHPHVGNVRGKGFFWGVCDSDAINILALTLPQIEFVADKATKEPFPRTKNVANAIHLVGLHNFGISLYPGNGTKDGVAGDHVLICPAYTSTEAELHEMVRRLKKTVDKTFSELEKGDSPLYLGQPASKL
jgi:adenosylmethionine-8-amino-7-oxononanoate aminotransferase